MPSRNSGDTGKGKKVGTLRGKAPQGRRSAPSKRIEKPFRLVVTKVGKTPKSSPFAETHPHMTEMRVELAKKPFRLEVGKTYETRDGLRKVTILRFEAESAFPFRGRFGKRGILSWREDGHYFTNVPECLDLVREVPGAQRPRAAAAKGSNPPKSKPLRGSSAKGGKGG